MPLPPGMVPNVAHRADYPSAQSRGESGPALRPDLSGRNERGLMCSLVGMSNIIRVRISPLKNKGGGDSVAEI